MDLSDLPMDYATDVVNEMIDYELLDSKNRKREELTLINGFLSISGILVLFPFAAHNVGITSNLLSFKQADSNAYNFKNLYFQLPVRKTVDLNFQY